MVRKPPGGTVEKMSSSIFEDQSPAVERALSAAESWAHRLAAPAVEPRHLLLGILDEAEGAAAGLLVRYGLDLARWKARHRGSGAADAIRPIPRSPAIELIFRDARRLSRSHATERAVTTDLVTAAMLRSDPVLAEELACDGLRRMEWDAHWASTDTAIAPDQPLDLADHTDRADSARILDAAANRAREAIRVLEDAARFSRDDAGLARELKQLRHDLAAALEAVPASDLLAARDTEHDVGVAIATESEGQRTSIDGVIAANVKRFQEALRSLEEYGKLFSADFAGRIEAIRYRSYSLERSLRRGEGGRSRLAAARLYLLVSAGGCRASLEWTIAESVAGGVDIVQLREKNLDDRRLIERAREVRRWTLRAGALMIVNDRPDIARLADADGVHLGQDDLPVRAARRILGPTALVGVSTHNLEQVRQAIADGADYIGVGPTFPSSTKSFDSLAGLEFVREAAALTALPAFVLGGVTAENIGDVVAAGGRRVAVSAAVATADDPRAAARAIRSVLDGAWPTERSLV